MKQIIYVIVGKSGFLHNFEAAEGRSMCWWSEDFLRAKLFPNRALCKKFKDKNHIDGAVTEIHIERPF